jgi:hypothetical protein
MNRIYRFATSTVADAKTVDKPKRGDWLEHCCRANEDGSHDRHGGDFPGQSRGVFDSSVECAGFVRIDDVRHAAAARKFHGRRGSERAAVD